MTNYLEYIDARKAVVDLIITKEKDIIDIEEEIKTLKKTRRMLDETFKQELNEKPPHIG